MENKELPAARHAVGALNLEEDPVVAAQARVDNLTGILARLLDDDAATRATIQPRKTGTYALPHTINIHHHHHCHASSS